MIKNRNAASISNVAESGKIVYLDGLRGVAALTVVFSHLVYMLFPAMQTGDFSTAHFPLVEKLVRYSPLSLIYGGSLAVYIFFVLSGYVLTYKYFKTRRQEIVVSGALRRYIRLMVPVLFVVLVACSLMYLGLFFNAGAAGVTQSYSWLSTFYDFKPGIGDALYQGMYGTFIHGDSSYNTVLWTISYEFFGSMLVYVMALFFGNLRHRWAFYGATAILLANTPYLAFIAGLALADLYNSADHRKYEVRNRAVLVLLLAGGLGLGSVYEAGILLALARFGIGLSTSLLPMIGAVLVLFVLLNSRFLQGLLSTALPRFLGRISFSMYLIHLIVICSLSSLVVVLLRGLPYYLLAPIVLAISISTILFLSDGIYRLIDMNGVRLSKYLYEALFSSEPDWPGKETAGFDRFPGPRREKHYALDRLLISLKIISR